MNKESNRERKVIYLGSASSKGSEGGGTYDIHGLFRAITSGKQGGYSIGYVLVVKRL